MRRLLLFILITCAGNIALAQISPYTGGNGSGSNANQSAPMLCGLYYGGINDGAALSFSPPTVCTMFYGGVADGAAFNNTPTIACPQFFGGINDGAAVSFSPLTICPPFFGGIGDGYDVDSFRFCQIILPLKILEFYGVKESNKNMLYWKVAEAQDLRWFEVERSGDGINFKKIGIVQAAGNLYQFPDDKPLSNVNYYRLRIVEQNNHIFYSNIVVLKSNGKNDFNVYPNPTKSHVNVYCYSAQKRTVTINLYDMIGRSIRQQVINLNKGGNNFIVHLENVPAGTYLLTINEMGESVRLVVVN